MRAIIRASGSIMRRLKGTATSKSANSTTSTTLPTIQFTQPFPPELFGDAQPRIVNGAKSPPVTSPGTKPNGSKQEDSVALRLQILSDEFVGLISRRSLRSCNYLLFVDWRNRLRDSRQVCTSNGDVYSPLPTDWGLWIGASEIPC